MTLHNYTPEPMTLPSINYLHLMVQEIQPGQTFSRRLPAHPDTMDEKVSLNFELLKFLLVQCLCALTLQSKGQNILGLLVPYMVEMPQSQPL